MMTAIDGGSVSTQTRELSDQELDWVIGGSAAGGGPAAIGSPTGEAPHLLVVIAIIAILIG